MRPPSQDRDKSVEKAKDKKNKDASKSKEKKRKTVSSLAGKPGDTVSELSTTGKPSVLVSESDPPATKIDMPGLSSQHSLGRTTTAIAASSVTSDSVPASMQLRCWSIYSTKS